MGSLENIVKFETSTVKNQLLSGMGLLTTHTIALSHVYNQDLSLPKSSLYSRDFCFLLYFLF